MKTKNELIFLQEAFHGIDFFERMRAELKPEDFLLLMRQLKFETVEAGEALFNVGKAFFRTSFLKGAICNHR